MSEEDFTDYVDERLREGLAFAQDHYDEWRGITPPSPPAPNRAQRRAAARGKNVARSRHTIRHAARRHGTAG
jgi:hypothetical protein